MSASRVGVSARATLLRVTRRAMTNRTTKQQVVYKLRRSETLEETTSRFYLTESGDLNPMSLDDDDNKGAKKHLRRLSEFVKAHSKIECPNCLKRQQENDTLCEQLEIKRAELRLMELAVNKVKEAYMDACLEIAELKRALPTAQHNENITPSSTPPLKSSHETII